MGDPPSKTRIDSVTTKRRRARPLTAEELAVKSLEACRSLAEMQPQLDRAQQRALIAMATRFEEKLRRSLRASSGSPSPPDQPPAQNDDLDDGMFDL